MRTLAASISLLLLPYITLAASAGFPSASLWLSNDAPQAGEEVRVFSVLYNGETAATSGTLQFLVDGEPLDTLSVSLDPGTSRILSTRWSAEAGSHTFSATFNGSAAGTQTSAPLSVSVATPPSPTEKALRDAQVTASTFIASSTPFVQKVAGTIVDTTEGLRQAGIDYLENVVDTSSNATSSTSSVAYLHASSSSASSTAQSPSLIHNASQVAAVGALFAFKTAWVFYILLLALLYFLFRTVKNWVNKPRF